MLRAGMFVWHSNVAPYGKSEGSLVVIIQSESGRIPVVATFHAGITQTIIQDITGFIVDGVDVNVIANGMIKFKLDLGLASLMVAKGQNRLIDDFTLDHHLLAFSLLFAGVIKEFGQRN